MFKKCYVATKVSSHFSKPGLSLSFEDRKRLVREEASRACMLVKKFGYIPISSPLLFIDVLDEWTERDKALEWGMSLLKECDCFAYFGSDLKVSRGINSELSEFRIFGNSRRIIDLGSTRSFDGGINFYDTDKSDGVLVLYDRDSNAFMMDCVKVGSKEERAIREFAILNSVYRIEVSIGWDYIVLSSWNDSGELVNHISLKKDRG